MSFRTAIALGAAVWCCGLLVSPHVEAQQGFDPRPPKITYSPLRVRSSLLGAMLVSKDQTGALGYDGFGGLLDASVGYEVMPWLEPRVSLLGGIFPSPAGAGGLLSPLFGLSLGTPNPALHIYGYGELGPGFTGQLVRMFVRFGVGIDFRVLPWLSLGPTFGYGQLFQDNQPGSTTDARMLMFGLSATFRPAEVHPPQPRNFVRTEYVREVVVVRTPAPAPPDEDVMQLLDNALPRARVELLAPVLFKFDSEELEPVGVAMLHEVAAELVRRPDIELVEIQGYADNRGSVEYNADLSLRRARRVLEWLVAHGVAAERLQVAAHGASNPVEAGSSEAEYEQNRRVVFRVLRTRTP